MLKPPLTLITWPVIQLPWSDASNTAIGATSSVLNHSGCKVLFLARAFRDFDFTETAARVKDEVPSLQHLVVFGCVERPGFVSWKDFLVRSCAESRRAVASVEVKVDEAANIQYTSGTTGAPKGATLSHLNLVNNAFLIGNRLGLVSSDKICLPVPMFHCFGMCVGVLSAFCFGATVVFPGESFEAGACLDAIESEHCTAFYGVPMMFIAMLNHERFDSGKVQSLRTGLMGGAPCPVEILRAAIERMHMRSVSVVYGMTESCWTTSAFLRTLPLELTGVLEADGSRQCFDWTERRSLRC